MCAKSGHQKFCAGAFCKIIMPHKIDRVIYCGHPIEEWQERDENIHKERHGGTISHRESRRQLSNARFTCFRVPPWLFNLGFGVLYFELLDSNMRPKALEQLSTYTFNTQEIDRSSKSTSLSVKYDRECSFSANTG